MAAPAGVLGGVGAVVGRRGKASAALALWGCGGPWCGPAAWGGIGAGRRVLGAAAGVAGYGGAWVQVVRVRWPWWSVRCPAWAGPPAVPVVVVVAGPPLRLSGLLAVCLASFLAGIVAAGAPAAVGVLFPFGSLPQLHSLVSGRLAGVFPALTRRGLALLPQKPIKRAYSDSKKSQKTHA